MMYAVGELILYISVKMHVSELHFIQRFLMRTQTDVVVQKSNATDSKTQAFWRSSEIRDVPPESSSSSDRSPQTR